MQNDQFVQIFEVGIQRIEPESWGNRIKNHRNRFDRIFIMVLSSQILMIFLQSIVCFHFSVSWHSVMMRIYFYKLVNMQNSYSDSTYPSKKYIKICLLYSIFSKKYWTNRVTLINHFLMSKMKRGWWFHRKNLSKQYKS